MGCLHIFPVSPSSLQSLSHSSPFFLSTFPPPGSHPSIVSRIIPVLHMYPSIFVPHKAATAVTGVLIKSTAIDEHPPVMFIKSLSYSAVRKE